MRDLTIAEIEVMRAGSVWDLGNQVLYDLCQRNPHHRTLDEIIAKVWLIGRAYAASIERRRNVEAYGDGFYTDTVGPAIQASGLDAWLESLSGVREPGHVDTVVIHKRLTDLFQNLTNLNKRSLASKYLHFHRPDLFYIYDSRADGGIRKVTPRLTSIPNMGVEGVDWTYRDFVRRCVWLRARVDDNLGVELSPREIDKILLTIADGPSAVGSDEHAVP